MSETSIITASSVREKAAEKLGFDQASALDLVDRSKFSSEEAYLDAAVKAEMERNNPEYRAVKSRLKAEYRQRTEKQQREEQEKAYQEIRNKISLDSLDLRNIDEEAVSLARVDLAANRIAASALGETIEKYAAELSEKRKNEKANNQLFNAILRGQL